MVKDFFERIQNNKAPLGKRASQVEGYLVFQVWKVFINTINSTTISINQTVNSSNKTTNTFYATTTIII